MTTCQEMFYLMNMELDGELTAEEQSQLDAHRAICPHCAALSEELRQMQVAMQNLPDMEPSEGFCDRVIEKIQQEERANTSKVIPFRRRVGRVGSLVACALLCVGLFRMDMLNLGAGESASSMRSMAEPQAMAATTTASSAESAPMMGAARDMAVADIEASVAETEMATETAVDSYSVLAPHQQVADLLQVDDIAWIVISPDELPQKLPEGMGEIVDTPQFSYSVVEWEQWETVCQSFGLNESIEAAQSNIPCVVIITIT